MAIKLKDSLGVWKDVAAVYLKNSVGTWKALSAAYVKNNNGWKEIFTLAIPSIQNQVAITSSSSYLPSTLTGRNYHWYNISENPKYIFQKSTDLSSWADMNNETTIANPSTGLSNTVTYTLSSSDFSQNDMYFRFSVSGINSAGAIYTSSSTPVMVSLLNTTTTPAPGTTTTTTPLLTCPGQYTNPTSYTCNELGLTYLGGSNTYNIPTNWECCGDPLPLTTGLTPVISDGVYISTSSVSFTVTNYNTSYTWEASTYSTAGNAMPYTITSSVLSATQIKYTVSGITQDSVVLRVTTSRPYYTTEYAEKTYTFPNIQVTNVVASSGADSGTGRKLSLSWTNVSGITRYMLQFAQDGTFNWTYAYNISNPFTSNLYYPYGTTYKMYVYGTDSQDNILNGSQSELTYWTPSATPTTTTSAPTTTTAAPTTTTAAPATTTTAAPTTTTAAPSFSAILDSKTSNSATISWSNAPGLTAFYAVYRSGMTPIIVSGTSYTFTGLSASTPYVLSVEARTSSNATIGYASVSVTTDSAPATTTTAAPATTTAAPATTTAAPATTTAAPATTTAAPATTTTAAPASYWRCSRQQLTSGFCCSNGLGGSGTCWSGGSGTACSSPTCS